MPIAKKIRGFIDRSSFIREMFEAGARLKAQVGPENVYDFSLGNPDLPPPPKFYDVLRELADDHTPGLHGYMPNAGWPDVREAVAAQCTKDFGRTFSAGDLVMTVGAGGGLNVALKTILDPGDEMIAITPYFVEYDFYADNHQGVLVRVASNKDFSLSVENIEAAITGKTRAVLINSPNNPTGVVYPKEDLDKLFALLARATEKNGRPIYLISDEPYRKLIYDGAKVPSVFCDYPYVMVVTSYSKDLSLPGDRIGFLAVHPEVPDKGLLMGGIILNNRILGYVNAPGLMQKIVARLQGTAVDVDIYKKRRDLFVAGLKDAGYDLVTPKGAFYLFPSTPIEDDVAFVRMLQEENILAVPGSGFFGPGHMRLHFCVPEPVIEKSLPGFKRAFEKAAG